MPMPAVRRHWTVDQVAELQQESRHWPRYELIDGELLVTLAPTFEHQLALTEFMFILDRYIEENRLGTMLASPSDIRLLPQSIVQPDLFIVPRPVGPRADRQPQWSDVKALLLAIEILSPDTAAADRIQKRELYMEAGVSDYWIVDLDGRIVEQWSPRSVTPTFSRDVLTWQPPGTTAPLTIELEPLFQKITGKRII